MNRSNIYENLELLPKNIQGWNGNSKIFEVLIKQIKPNRILEVGTWKGQSAITMGNVVRSNDLKCEILCVDTWLGSLEFIGDTSIERDRLLKNGYPQIYYQFLSNVVHENLEKYIIPFPITDRIAFEYLQEERYKADLIYIDASHSYGDVYWNVENFIQLLNTNGIIFGDDYSHWPSVRNAIDDYCTKHKIEKQVVDGFWIIGSQTDIYIK